MNGIEFKLNRDPNNKLVGFTLMSTCDLKNLTTEEVIQINSFVLSFPKAVETPWPLTGPATNLPNKCARLILEQNKVIFAHRGIPKDAGGVLSEFGCCNAARFEFSISSQDESDLRTLLTCRGSAFKDMYLRCKEVQTEVGMGFAVYLAKDSRLTERSEATQTV